MSSVQRLHRLLFSISILLSITLSASSTAVPSPPVPSSGQKYADPARNSTATTESLAQGATVTRAISVSSIQADTITTESPSFSQSSTVNTMISPSPNQDNSTDLATTTSTNTATADSTDMVTTNSTHMATTNSIDMATTNSTDMATTLLPVTTDVTQTIGLTTTKNSPTSQTSFSSLTSSTSVPTTQSAQTSVTFMSASIPTENGNTTASFKTQEPHLGLRHSEASITIFFGVMLGLTVLTIAGYSLHRCKLKNSQYIHQPLYNSAEDTGDRLSAPGDTLVISGGLYDGPEIFNSTLTTDEDMGFHSDQPFAPQPAQFRLEFLSEDQLKLPDSTAHTFETFQPFDAKD